MAVSNTFIVTLAPLHRLRQSSVNIMTLSLHIGILLLLSLSTIYCMSVHPGSFWFSFKGIYFFVTFLHI